MQVEIDKEIYNVIINHKDNKNMYLRVKDDLNIYVNAPYHVSNKEIKKFIKDNENAILGFINSIKNKLGRNAGKFEFLGDVYDICYTNTNDIIFGDTKVFIGKEFNLDRWYYKKASIFFEKRLNSIWNSFEEKIPFPDLKIRRMKGKWGVCNVTNEIVTLNLTLIKMHPKYLDYVIVHELSHFIYPNHSSEFWELVGKYVKNYKQYRNEMKNIL